MFFNSKDNRNLMLVVLMFGFSILSSCSNSVTKIPSEIDNHMGTWITKNNMEYSYSISIKAKDKIAQSANSEEEKWRKMKESVLIFYLTDIDSNFGSIGSHEISIGTNKTDLSITENGITYTMRFESYKGVYFPKSVYKLIIKQ